jgi:hypothetical protein
MARGRGFFMKYLLVFILLFTTSCALVSDKSVQTSAELLKSTQESIIDTAGIIDEMCASGDLSQSQCDRASKLYSESKSVYTKALEAQLLIVEAQLTKKEIEDAESIREKSESALQRLLLIMNKLSSIRE